MNNTKLFPGFEKVSYPPPPGILNLDMVLHEINLYFQ